MSENIQSHEVLNTHYKSVLSALQDLKDCLYGNRVDMTFNSCGGSVVKSRKVYMGQSYGELPKPTRAGYDFQGWYGNYDSVSVPGEEFYADPINDFDPVNVSTHAITVYAKWEPAWIPVRLHANGGVVEPDEISVKYLTFYMDAYRGPGFPTGIPTPVSEENTFLYWSSDTAGMNRVTESTTMVMTSPVDLYANWEMTIFNLHYDSNGGRGTIPPLTANAGQLCSIVSLDVARQSMSKVGYDLLGFSLVRNTTNTIEPVQLESRNLTAYAVWGRHRYTIDYRSDKNNSRLEPLSSASSVTNPHGVMVDWIDYLHFIEGFRIRKRIRRRFRRWTSTNEYVKNLMPYDGDLIYNYSLTEGDNVQIRPASNSEMEATEKWRLEKVELSQNGFKSGYAFTHGDTLSSDMSFKGSGWGKFKLKAYLKSNIDNSLSTINNLEGNSIRVYPTMAKYIKPVDESSPGNNSYAIVSFAFNDESKGVKVPITVQKTIDYIEVISYPAKTQYVNGEPMAPRGLAVSAVYADGADTEVITYMAGSKISCSMSQTINAQGYPNTALTAVTMKSHTMFVFVKHGNDTVSAEVEFKVSYATDPVLEVTATGSNINKSFEPEGLEYEQLNQSNYIANRIGLVVKKKYPNENRSTLPDPDHVPEERVYDYTYEPKDISEDNLTTPTPTDPQYMGTVNISVQYHNMKNDQVLTGTTPVSVYKPYAISSITAPSNANLGSYVMDTSDRNFFILDPSVLTANFNLTGYYNRPAVNGVQKSKVINIKHCNIVQDVAYPTDSVVSVRYGDSNMVTIPITITLPTSCYCGYVKVDLAKLRAGRTTSPTVMPQCRGGDYSYYCTSDKYIRYELTNNTVVTKRSPNDYEGISITEWNTMRETISVYYTSPAAVQQLNNHFFDRQSCGDEKSCILEIVFNQNLDNLDAVRYIGAYQRFLTVCLLGSKNSKIKEVGSHLLAQSYNFKQGIVYSTTNCTSAANDIGKLLLPKYTTLLGTSAFRECTSITHLSCFSDILNEATLATTVAVTSIGENCFYSCTSLIDVNSRIFGRIGPESEHPQGNPNLRLIGDKAFYGCTSLQGISLREVKQIGLSAFKGCSNLQNVAFNPQWTYHPAGHDAFTIGYKLEAVADYAFANCKAGLTVSHFKSSVAGNRSRIFSGTTNYHTTE